MKWKIYLIACVSIFLLTFFPSNIIGCGPETDPYDYYTSFFQNNLAADKTYHPFLYTNMLFLYDENEPVDAAHATSAEWINYCGNTATKKEAYDFVCRFEYNQLATLYKNIENNNNAALRDSVTNNSITKYFMQQKDLEALGYLMYAKKVEPTVTLKWDEWEPTKPDSVLMARLIKNGTQLYNAAKSDFIKLRYAYQITRLALYSGNAKDCIRYYDEMISSNPTNSVLQMLAVSLKAGALYKTGDKYTAALLFSKQFSASPVKRVANYLSFNWCVNRLDEKDRAQCLSLCKTDEDKANLLALFALGSADNEETTLKNIYAISPQSEMLQVLVVREINKIEENYFTPALDEQKGGNKPYFNWYDDNDAAKTQAWYNEATSLSGFCHAAAQNAAITNKALFETGAAYLAYIIKDYAHAKQYLQNVESLNPSQKIKDQAALTRLLVTINEQPVIDSNFEATLLPSIKWLQKKALDESKTLNTDDYWQATPWRNFYRNLFDEILAKRYHAQNEIYKEALCIGNAENIARNSNAAEEFVEDSIQTKDILQLHNLLISKNKTAWQQYVCNNFTVADDKVKEVLAVSYARDFDFSTSLQWFQKVTNNDLLQLEHNPFADILIDAQDSVFSFDNGHFDKIDFLKEMLRLTDKEKENKATADDFYKLATSYYNMTYYGRAWQVIKYWRSGVDGYYVPPDALPYEREYYGCYTAEKYYRKAMQAYTDKNRQARCLFMMAKCAQKRNKVKPDYDFGYSGDTAAFFAFKYNAYFPQLVNDYKTTAFFKEAYNTCSYLKDFVKKK